MGTRLTIGAPRNFAFHRDVCSYGYFLLAPNVWDPDARTLTRPLNLPEGVAVVRLAQPEGAGTPLTAAFDRALARSERAPSQRMIARMLRLDDDIDAFHAVDPRWKPGGRGRLFRSPTFFEDLIKTVTSCNVTWPSTVSMNRKLCEAFNPAFPTPAQLRRRRPQTLRARCGVGYRDARIVELARMVEAGAIDVEWMEDPATPDDDLHKALLDLPGIGPYAAANVMMLLGRYARLAIDTETLRHARDVLGMEGTDAELTRRVRAHYEPFGDHRFRSYWFEVWTHYEGRKGPAWEWAPREVATAFTASKLKQPSGAR